MVREDEMYKRDRYYEAWSISKKYTSILMLHEKDNGYFCIAPDIHSQYLSELQYKKMDISNQRNYIQVWDTMINTINNNPKEDVCRIAIRLLHQTSIQRSFRED